jgi:SAM-dependent methyltransferase
MGSSISHYSSMNTDHLRTVLAPCSSIEEVEGTHNFYAVGDVSNFEGINDADVPDRFHKLADGSGLNSRLAWADTLRNVRAFEAIRKSEPIIHLDIGCGMSHPLGRFIKGQELDTTYIGIDPVEERARGAAYERNTARSFVGIHHDARQGLPLANSTVDFITCFATLEHFVYSGEEMMDFLAEVKRVSLPGTHFILSTSNRGHTQGPYQHPHCHMFEFTDLELMECFAGAGFTVESRYNYRARPSQIARVLSVKSLAPPQSYAHYPAAFADSMMLPDLTWNDPIPGNVMYWTRTPRA